MILSVQQDIAVAVGLTSRVPHQNSLKGAQVLLVFVDTCDLAFAHVSQQQARLTQVELELEQATYDLQQAREVSHGCRTVVSLPEQQVLLWRSKCFVAEKENIVIKKLAALIVGALATPELGPDHIR